MLHIVSYISSYLNYIPNKYDYKYCYSSYNNYYWYPFLKTDNDNFNLYFNAFGSSVQ